MDAKPKAWHDGVRHLLRSARQSTALGRLGLLLAVVVSACQFPDEPVPQQSSRPVDTTSPITPEYVAGLPPEQSRPAVNRLANQVVKAELAVCQQNSDVDWDACVNSRMLVGFDRYGFLANHCRDRIADNQALRDCVLFGRAGVDWLLAIGKNPDTDFDWSQPEKAHDAALEALNDTLTKQCEGKPENPGNSCFTRESAKALGLGNAVAFKCAERQTLEHRGACIVDAHDAAMYQAALAVLRS